MRGWVRRVNVIGEVLPALGLALSKGLTSVSYFTLACDVGYSVISMNSSLYPLYILRSSERNGIGGTLPSEISRFMDLKYLLLEEGLISGSIPSDIGFNGKLVQLDLNFNAMTGAIPESIYRLSNLEQLDLNDNQFTGTISTSISGLKQLVFIQLEQNTFTGTIPEEMGNLFLLGKSWGICKRRGGGTYRTAAVAHQSSLRVAPYVEVATLENNELQGAMPDLVCENRTGLLQVLTADCLGAPSRPSPPYVECPCCTQCF